MNVVADPRLYECLALIDVIRVGRARERKLAETNASALAAFEGEQVNR
jgi:hypothetical protein